MDRTIATYTRGHWPLATVSKENHIQIRQHMTSNLRKAHKVIWLFLIIVVPLALIFSVLGIQASTLTDADISNQRIHTEAAILDNDQLIISLNQQEKPYSVMMVLKKSLSSPTPVAYAVSSSAKESSPLGAMDTKGMYTFPVDRSVKSIRIYDELKKVELLTVDLPWD